MRSAKTLAAGMVVAIAATLFVSTADAGRRHHYYGHGGYYHHGDAFAAGVLGFAAGALLSGGFAGRGYYGYHPYYYGGYAPQYYYAPQPYYHHAPRYYDDYDDGYYHYGPCDLPGGQVSRPAWAMC